jgi:hypothetical protein
MNQFNLMSFTEQSEAMQIICNLQTIKNKIYNIQYYFEDFNQYTIDELRYLQNNLLIKWNNKIKEINK